MVEDIFARKRAEGELGDITHPDDLAASVAPFEQMRGGKINRYDLDKRYLRKDGAIVWVRATVSCLRQPSSSAFFDSIGQKATHAVQQVKRC